MAYTDTLTNSRDYSLPDFSLDNNNFYSKVMLWLAVCFGAAAAGVFIFGPMVPQSLITPLWAVAFIALLVAGFSRKIVQLSGFFAVGIPLILGIVLYPTLNYYVQTGMGNIIGQAAGGTAIIFGGMALWGWTSKKSINNWASKLFFIMLGLIAVSVLNMFLHSTGLSFIISLAVVVVMSMYTFIDIQSLRDRNPYDQIPASYYAFNIFLNIYNIFVSLLNILSIISK